VYLDCVVAQDPRFWQATSHRDGSSVVIKLVASGGVEFGTLQKLTGETALRVVPVLAVVKHVCSGWHGIMMPRLTTLSHLLASFAECEDDSVGEAIVSGMSFSPRSFARTLLLNPSSQNSHNGQWLSTYTVTVVLSRPVSPVCQSICTGSR
jgi:hypothetical protein